MPCRYEHVCTYPACSSKNGNDMSRTNTTPRFRPRKILLNRQNGILFHHRYVYVVVDFIDDWVGGVGGLKNGVLGGSCETVRRGRGRNVNARRWRVRLEVNLNRTEEVGGEEALSVHMPQLPPSLSPLSPRINYGSPNLVHKLLLIWCLHCETKGCLNFSAEKKFEEEAYRPTH